MAETLKIALRGFWRGFVDLGRGFDWSCQTGQCAADRFIVSLARVFAFLLTVLLLQCGTYLIAADKPLGGYVSLILGLLSAITAIAAGGKSQKQ